MKKIIALLLMAVMCLSFAACGDISDELSQIAAEHAKDSSEDAVISDGNAAGDNAAAGDGAASEEDAAAKEDTEIVEQEKHQFSDHQDFPYICGQWKLRPKESYNQPDGVPATDVTINENGTCEIDGVFGLWTISDVTREDFLRLDIHIDGKHKFGVGYYDNASSIAIWEAGYKGVVDTCWLRLDRAEIIELTADNWQDYLEIRTYVEPKTDELGEVENLHINVTMELKDEYAARYVSSEGTVEIRTRNQCMTNLEYNKANGTFALTQGEVFSAGTSSSTAELNLHGPRGFGLPISAAANPESVQENGDIVTATAQFYQSIEVSKMQVTVYLEK